MISKPSWSSILLASFLFFLCSSQAALATPGSAAESFRVVPSKTEISLTGFTRPITVMEVASEISGRCLEVNAAKGEPIPQNGSFTRLDSTFVLLELEANKLALQQAQRQLQFDEQEVKRYTRLVTMNSSSQVRLDELLLRRDQARTTLKLLKVESRRLQEQLARHRVKAPPNWLVMERRVEPGEWIQPGRVLAKIGDFSQLIIPLALTPDELIALKQIQNKIPLLLLDTGEPGVGKLFNVSPGFDPASRKILAEIKVELETLAPELVNQGGMRIQVSLQVPDPSGSFLVLERAVERHYEKHWLTRENGELLQVVVLGPADNVKNNTEKWLRVTSPKIKRGDLFLIP